MTLCLGPLGPKCSTVQIPRLSSGLYLYFGVLVSLYYCMSSSFFLRLLILSQIGNLLYAIVGEWALSICFCEGSYCFSPPSNTLHTQTFAGGGKLFINWQCHLSISSTLCFDSCWWLVLIPPLCKDLQMAVPWDCHQSSLLDTIFNFDTNMSHTAHFFGSYMDVWQYQLSWLQDLPLYGWVHNGMNQCAAPHQSVSLVMSFKINPIPIPPYTFLFPKQNQDHCLRHCKGRV